MKRILLGLTFFIVTIIAHAQTKKESKGLFAFIEITSDIADTNSLKHIHTFSKTSVKGDDLVSLYQKIKLQAQNAGANCFKFTSFSRDSIGRMTLVLDTYFGDNEFIRTNDSNHEKNSVYVISDGDFSDQTYSFQIDKFKKEIASGTYYKHTIPKSGKVKINKGGFSGTTVTINWEENKLCRFYSISGFGLADFPIMPYPVYARGPGIGIAFTTGKIKPVDRDFGLLLTLILKQQH